MEVSKLLDDISSSCLKMQKKFFTKGSIITTYMEKRKQICILLNRKSRFN